MRANICLAEGKHEPSCGDKLLCEIYQIFDGRNLSEYDKSRNIGMGLCSVKRYDEALGYLNEAIDLEPNNPLAYSDKATVLHIQGKPEEALECQNKATELDPKNAGYWEDKGWTLKMLKRYGEGICCFENARSLKEDDFYYQKYLDHMKENWK